MGKSAAKVAQGIRAMYQAGCFDITRKDTDRWTVAEHDEALEALEKLDDLVQITGICLAGSRNNWAEIDA